MVKKQDSEQENVVHVRVNLDQAVASKKQLLVSQIDILKFMKGINRYFQYRNRELDLREELKRESKELNDLIKEFKNTLPRVEEAEKSKLREDLASINRREVIESDLEAIKEKLARLGKF